MKLPKDVPLPVAPVAADAAAVTVPPAVIDPGEVSLFRTTGDWPPLFFCPAGVGDCVPPPGSNGGDEPPTPVALAGAQVLPLHYFQRNRTISLIFCRSDRVVGCVSGFGPWREHQEGCLLNTPVYGHYRPQFVSANFSNAREIRPTFHFQEDQ